MRASRRAWVLASCLLVAVLQVPRPARADTVVGIMSEASAPEFAAAAQIFVQREPGHRLLFRSTQQLAKASDAELALLLGEADRLILAAVFGEEAERVLAALEQQRPATVVPLHGDQRLLSFAQLEGERVYPTLSPAAAGARLKEQAAGPEPSPAELGKALRPEQFLARAQRYRDGRGPENMARLLSWVVAAPEARARVPAPTRVDELRMMAGDRPLPSSLAGLTGPVVALIDYQYGDEAGNRELHQALCSSLRRHQIGCVSLLARWGQASIDGVKALGQLRARDEVSLVGVVQLQDFVLGGGVDSQGAVQAIRQLGVPFIKAIRLTDRGVGAWRVSEDGLPDDSVHYRLSMPELQGAGQPLVVAAAGEKRVDALTGLELQPLTAIPREIEALSDRLARWQRLARLPNADKRIAIVYYNHPPGRHNIGADNLDVPASLLSVLQHLKAAGYTTGELPETKEELLQQLLDRGVNLPENERELRRMSESVASLSQRQYERYFEGLPEQTRRTMVEGPLGSLLAQMRVERDAQATELLQKRVKRVIGDVRHLLEGAAHPERQRALGLLATLEQQYAAVLSGRGPSGKASSGQGSGLEELATTSRQLRATGIEGLSGWGEPPGKGMTVDGNLLVPGLTFGNVFIGPQPPRGWELNEELLHANLAFPPPHQYLAFYEYLRSEHRADAVVHLGRHSTYEFLPGKRTGLSAGDFSRIVLGDLPSVYVYIVDGVGEGIQAKRRGQAVIVDHLTPSLSTTPLYDDLLSLRQLVESYEASAGIDGHAAGRALSEIHATVERLHLREELEASMAPELEARGIRFEEADPELLVHEVGHYLTRLQERFMPHGLHVFGQAWKPQAVDRMLASMAGQDEPEPEWRRALEQSPQLEAGALLRALSGGFVEPGPGNDPVRTPEVLPTGRNFHALDASVLPTRLAYELGVELAQQSRDTGKEAGSEAIVLWASDTVRDEGAMVAFGLDMMGVEPVWNSRGIVRGMQRVTLEGGRTRRDTAFVTSGLFRDLYGHLMDWLDYGVLVALDGASRTIERQHPELSIALDAALARLGVKRAPGNESLEVNQLAAQWVRDTQLLLGQGVALEAAGRSAAARVFGDAPGSYGAGINRLAERSGSWQSRDELAKTYVRRIGHAYGGGREGQPAHDALKRQLARTERTYLGRASHLYGLLDNNDVFDYLGGLSTAVEAERGKSPNARVVQHADPKAARVQALPEALKQELRGRHLNPHYLQPLMAHGYAGARTMGSGFIENLWGWQITSPEIVQGWIWDETKAVYLDDEHDIGLDEFLSQDANVHVKTNIQAVFLVAAHKGFWKPGEATLRQLSEDFARAVVQHGLPGSGHTRPDHPMMAEIAERLSAELARDFQTTLDEALGRSARLTASELSLDAPQGAAVHASDVEHAAGEGSVLSDRRALAGLGLAAALFAAAGFFFERRRGGAA